MKNSRVVPLVLIMFMILAASCSFRDSGEMTEIPQMIDVVIRIEPDELLPGEPVSIQAAVTQDGKPVEDAEEVTFEIWREGQNEDEHEKLAGKHQGDGIYFIEKTFPEPGIYYVISHVTARGAHNMPKKKFAVGEAAAEETERADSSGQNNGQHHH